MELVDVPDSKSGARDGVRVRAPPPAPNMNRQGTLPFFFLGSIMIWKPNVTVAAVIERDGKFLLVEEETAQGLMFNQPAGHWEKNETLPQATMREVLEESAYHFNPQHLIGIYRWNSDHNDVTYLRFAFSGRITEHEANRVLDDGITRTVWMAPDEIRASQARHRSPLLLCCVEDYLAGKRFPLDLLVHYE